MTLVSWCLVAWPMPLQVFVADWLRARNYCVLTPLALKFSPATLWYTQASW